jgi:hypothetical protein
MESWIDGENVRPWCELLSEIVGYAFDDLDWDAVRAGKANADRHKGVWFDYAFQGTETIRVRMAYDVWQNNVSVTWEAPPHLDAAIKVATSVCQRYKLGQS